jgi:uncharacterized protein (TIRG00374 family)
MTVRRLYKNTFVILVNLAVFIALLNWLQGNVRLEGLLKSADALPIAPILLGVFINLIAVLCAGVRLAVLLQRPFSMGFQVINLGFGFNAVLPLRMGEFARLYYAKRLFGLPAAQHFMASLVEKCFDLSVIVVLLLGLVAYGQATYFGHDLLLSLLIVILATGAGVSWGRRLLPSIFRLVSRSRVLTSLVEGFSAHAKIHGLGWVGLVTLGIWIANAAVAYISFAGFLPAVDFTIIDAIILVLVTALVVAIPGAPSGLGVFEAGIVIYLTRTYDVDNELALASAFVFHAIVTVPQVIMMIGVFAIRLNKQSKVIQKHHEN